MDLWTSSSLRFLNGLVTGQGGRLELQRMLSRVLSVIVTEFCCIACEVLEGVHREQGGYTLVLEGIS